MTLNFAGVCVVVVGTYNRGVIDKGTNDWSIGMSSENFRSNDRPTNSLFDDKSKTVAAQKAKDPMQTAFGLDTNAELRSVVVFVSGFVVFVRESETKSWGSVGRAANRAWRCSVVFAIIRCGWGRRVRLRKRR